MPLTANTISNIIADADAPMKAVTAYFNAFIDGKLDSLRTHAWLVGVIAVAEISLGVGIWLESPKHKTLREWVGVLLVLGGCLLSVIATVALLIFDEGISRSQSIEIISLRKNAIPRSIDVSAFSKQLVSVPPVRAEIRYVVACGDCESLSFWLSEALKKANWSVDPIIPIAPQDRDWVRVVRSLHAQSSGITIVIDSPDKITADPKTSLGALNGAVLRALGFNFFGYASNVQGGVDATMPDGMIRIVVAPKP